MPIQHYNIDDGNKVDDRLIGYSIDVETVPNYDPDIAAICKWVQGIAIGLMDDGWTHNYLIEESVNIRIVDKKQVVIVDTIKNREPIDAA